MDVDRNTDKISLSNIVDYILENGENIDFSDIEYLISERCSLDGYPEKSFHEFTLWKDLKELVQGNDKITLKTRKQISDYYNKINKPFFSDSTNDNNPISLIEIENLSQLINLYHYTGIFDFIKSEYTIHNNDHTTMAKLFCYLSQTELKGKEHFNTIVSHIKNIDNAPKKILSEKGKRKFESICIELNITKRKKEHP